MSYQVYVSPFFEPPLQVNGYLSIARRIISNGGFQHAIIFDNHDFVRKSPELSGLDLRSSAFESLLHDLDDSDKGLFLQLCYPLIDGSDWAPMTLKFFGKRHLGGSCVARLGRIEIIADENDLTRPHQKVLHEHMNTAYRLNKVGDEPPVVENGEKLRMRALKVAEELLFDVCGIGSQEVDVRPVHAYAYREMGMLPPQECSMVYHRNSREFARDIVRAYLSRYCQTMMPEMLSAEFSQASFNDIDRHYLANLGADPREWESPIKPFSWWDASAVDFINDLKHRDLSRCETWDSDAVDLFLLELAEHQSLINYHLFSHGSALSTHPSYHLASVYGQLVDGNRLDS